MLLSKRQKLLHVEPRFEAPKLPPRPPQGYACDWLDTEVLLQRLTVKDGKLVLPEGMQYRLLLLDPEDDALPPEALRKIIQLARDGATIVLGPRQPLGAPGLKNYPACDEEVRRLAAELWGNASNQPFRREIGKGKIVGGTNIEEELAAQGILPDCAGPCEYAHRQAGDLDIYFVSGTGEMECTFRAGGREPELWDPKTGTMRDAVCYRTTDGGRTIVPLSLPDSGSMFVVFRKPIRQPHVVRVAGPPSGMEIEGRDDAGLHVCLWQKGRYVFETSLGKQAAIDAATPDPVNVTGPWELRFAPGWGAAGIDCLPGTVGLERARQPGHHALFGHGHVSQDHSTYAQQAAASGTAAIGRGEVRRQRAAQRERPGRGVDQPVDGRSLGAPSSPARTGWRST